PCGPRPGTWASWGSRPRAGWPTTTASPTRRSRPPAGSSGPARPSTTRARRGRSRAAASTTPTARPTSPPSSGGPRPPPPTPGRTVAHFLSGNQTRRLPGLVEQTPRPWIEVNPSLGFADGDPVRVVTRRGTVTSPALVTEAIRPDTVFVPYHWAGPIAANVLTIDALDPISKMPELKVCACRVTP